MHSTAGLTYIKVYTAREEAETLVNSTTLDPCMSSGVGSNFRVEQPLGGGGAEPPEKFLVFIEL